MISTPTMAPMTGHLCRSIQLPAVLAALLVDVAVTLLFVAVPLPLLDLVLVVLVLAVLEESWELLEWELELELALDQ